MRALALLCLIPLGLPLAGCVNAMCANGYVVDTRHFVPGPPTASGPQFSNGGDVVYAGRCIAPSAPPPSIAPPPLRERG
jgi:hypothetical protein